MVPGVFDAYCTFNTRFTVKNRYFLPVKWPKWTKITPKWQILGQVWLLEPNVDWTKVMGVVPEQIPGDSGCI